jgi:hypothetical protein
MGPLEVKLLKGQPTNAADSTPSKQGDEFGLWWLFRSDGGDGSTMVTFYGPTPDSLKAAIVCARGGYSTLLGLGRFNTEKDVLTKLGEPTSQSIGKDGLSKIISFKPLKVAYELTKGSVSEICVTESGTIGYVEEYPQ